MSIKTESTMAMCSEYLHYPGYGGNNNKRIIYIYIYIRIYIYIKKFSSELAGWFQLSCGAPKCPILGHSEMTDSLI